MSNHHHHHKKHVWWKWLLGIVCVFLLVDGVVLAKFYFSAKDAVDRSFKKVNYKKKREKSVDMSRKQPFSVLLLGSDTGEYGRTYRGRTDTIMVAAVTPSQTTLVSVPRDTLVHIEGHPGNNKINAAYSYDGMTGGVEHYPILSRHSGRSLRRIEHERIGAAFERNRTRSGRQ